MGKKRSITENKAKKGSIEEEKFNVEFWKKIEGSRKLEIAWEMVSEFFIIRGKKDATQQRLRRSVENIQRRKG